MNGNFSHCQICEGSHDTEECPRIEALRAVPCSRSFASESKIEEIIACLWSLMLVILWVNNAPQWMLWAVGIKAVLDHLCAVLFAIRGIRSENAEVRHGAKDADLD